jgi:acyl-CoA thioesterase-2
MNQELKDLLDLLDLEQIEVNMFRGTSSSQGWQGVYGGQVIGQALVAASRTVEDETRSAHSLHGYFLRPGDTTIPILYSVDRIRDGKSFTTRRVVAIQKGEAIFSMSVSFQILETGLEHQIPIPDVPTPEDCISEQELYEKNRATIPESFRDRIERPRPIEMRFVDPVNEFQPEPKPPYQHVWIRTVDEMPEDVRLNQCLLAYASDMTLLDTSYRPHAKGCGEGDFQVASLDHAMWFHKSFKTDEWMLYQQDSPFSGGARGFSRGTLYDVNGDLIVSVAQEGLIRVHQAS